MLIFAYSMASLGPSITSIYLYSQVRSAMYSQLYNRISSRKYDRTRSDTSDDVGLNPRAQPDHVVRRSGRATGTTSTCQFLSASPLSTASPDGRGAFKDSLASRRPTRVSLVLSKMRAISLEHCPLRGTRSGPRPRTPRSLPKTNQWRGRV